MKNHLIIMPVFLIVMGIAFLFLGLKIVKKKAFFVKSKFMFLFLLFCFLPTIIHPFSLLFRHGFNLFRTCILFVPAIMFVVFLLFMKRNFGFVMIFNVTEDLFYDSIFEALSKNNISYEEKRSQIILKDINASIKVNIQGLGNTAVLSFIGIQNIPNLEKILHDFQISLQEKHFTHKPIIGIVYTIFAILFMLMGTGMLLIF